VRTQQRDIYTANLPAKKKLHLKFEVSARNADTLGMKRVLFGIFVPLMLAITVHPVITETFRYRFTDGDTFRINSMVWQDVYVNRRFSHSAEITNRITVRVSDVQPRTADTPASALYEATFMTSERTSNRSFSWGREYPSRFRRDEFGVYTISDEYFMPVVRNVPTFPEQPLKPGDTWTGTGEEAHDLRDHFGVMTPFRVPFTVKYTYEGPGEFDGRAIHIIRAEYNIFHQNPPLPRTRRAAEQRDRPVATKGYSNQRILWDNTLGTILFYSEDYRIVLEMESGNLFEFRGTAEARVTETNLFDRDRMVRELNEQIQDKGISNATVSASDEGITISLENIQFEPDSARLVPSELEKIRTLATILEGYPDRELLITGHTALAGTAASRQQLSEERAEAVARILIEMGVRSPYNVYTRGFGADRPIVPNTTEPNRARNRRVEITILER